MITVNGCKITDYDKVFIQGKQVALLAVRGLLVYIYAMKNNETIDFTDMTKIIVNDGKVDFINGSITAMSSVYSIIKTIDFTDMADFTVNDGVWIKDEGKMAVSV